MIFPDVRALKRFVRCEKNHDQAVRVTWSDAMQKYCFTADGDLHVLVEDNVRQRGRNSLTDNWLDGPLISDNRRAGSLKNLSATYVIGVRVSVYHTLHRHVKPCADLVKQPLRG